LAPAHLRSVTMLVPSRAIRRGTMEAPSAVAKRQSYEKKILLSALIEGC
jgi:hypothetical protein